MYFVKSNDFLRPFLEGTESVDLCFEFLLTNAGLLEFFIHDPLTVRIGNGPLEFLLQSGDVAVADSLLESSSEPAFEYLREASQLLLDRLGLSDKDFQDPVLLTVGVDEIVAVDLFARLEFAVDPAVALFQAARVPRHVEVEQVPAVGLEVQALPRGIRGDQNADRMPPGVRGERTLDLLTLGRRGRPVVDGDALAGPVGTGDGCPELLLEIALGVVVFGEDEDTGRVSPGRGARGLHRAERR
jgi:hypothetical protein